MEKKKDLREPDPWKISTLLIKYITNSFSGEVIQNIESEIEVLDRTKLHISLDILCLTLPSKVQNVITEYSSKGLRTTSFCSDGFQPSIGSPDSETSFTE